MYALKSEFGYWLSGDDHTLDKDKATRFDSLRSALFWRQHYGLYGYQPTL